MPYDDMDKFVAFSKCLAGLDRSEFTDLADKVVDQMHRLLDKMRKEQEQEQQESAFYPNVDPNSLSFWSDLKPDPESKPPKLKSPPVELRDALLRSCREVLQYFALGASFDTAKGAQLNLLSLLSDESIKFRNAVERSQQQNRGRK
jgi:hypothetical protein